MLQSTFTVGLLRLTCLERPHGHARLLDVSKQSQLDNEDTSAPDSSSKWIFEDIRYYFLAVLIVLLICLKETIKVYI